MDNHEKRVFSTVISQNGAGAAARKNLSSLIFRLENLAEDFPYAIKIPPLKFRPTRENNA